MSRSRFGWAPWALVAIASCSGQAKEGADTSSGTPAPASRAATPAVVAGPGEVLITGHPVKFILPDGWTVTRNDGNESGALVVLQENAAPKLRSTICLWLGAYDEKLASELGVTRGAVKVQLALTGVQPDAAVADFEMDMAGSVQGTTTNNFLDFKAASSSVVATVLARSQDSGSTYFSISAAASDRSMGKVKAIADGLATQILKSLAATGGK